MTRKFSLSLGFGLSLALTGCGNPLVSDLAGIEEGDELSAAAALTVPGKVTIVNTAGSGLRLRSTPSTTGAVLAVIPEGTEVDLIDGPQNAFYKTRYSGKEGWAHGNYMQQSGGGGGGGIFRPKPGTSWQWQLSGTINTSFAVKMYDIDLFDAPQSTIDALRAAGRVVICYFSAGSYENWRSDAGQFPAAALGKALDGWPGERWLDVRSSAVRDIMKARLDRAKSRRCDGVEPDNVDGYANSSGFPLTGAHQIDFNRFLAREAHARGLSIGLKNDLDQIPSLVSDFDWALNEQCFQYNECDTLKPFINAGKAVFSVEYGSASLASSVCPKARSLNFDTLIKNLNLDATRTSCR